MTTTMKLSAAFLPLLLGCAPNLILPPVDPDAAQIANDAADAGHPDAAPDTGSTEVAVADAPEDAAQVDAPEATAPDVLPPEDVVDAPDVEADTGAGDTGTDVADVVLPDAGPRDTGTDVSDVQDVVDVTDTPDVVDAADVVDVPVVPLDLGPPPCLPGQDRCGGSVCLNLSTDIANCGGCGNACPARPHAPATCSGGACTLVCDPGTLNCDGNLTNGCETIPSMDVANCGGCGMACPSYPNTVPTMCVGGACSFACATGYANCDGLRSNGCEAMTDTDPMNCGGCGVRCGSGQTCRAGVCMCPTGWPACGGVCPDQFTDVNNCGTCGVVCGTGNGCCTGYCRDFQNDSRNCGGCRVVCPGTSTCSAGRCVCPSGQTLCGTACVDRSSDPRNCGACGVVCPGSARRCVNYHCTA